MRKWFARFGITSALWVLPAFTQTFTAGPSVVVNADHRLEIFARGSDSAVWHNWQNTPGGSWNGWSSLGGSISGIPASVVNADGHLEVFALEGSTVYHNWQTSPGGGWSGWVSMGGNASSPPNVIRNADGRVEVFARGNDCAAWHSWQVYPSGPFSAWNSLGGCIAESPKSAENADGRLEIFALGGSTVYHAWESSPGGNWTGWSSLGGASIATTPTAATNNDGRLEIFARGTDNAGWHLWQTSPGGAWGTWSSMGGLITGSSPSIETDANAALQAFAINSAGAPYYNSQESNWAGWTPLGGTISAAPGTEVNFDGRVEIFGIGTDGAIWHNWQTSPAGPWSGWAPLSQASNAGDTNGPDLPYYLTYSQNDANYAAAKNGGSQPPWLSAASAWPCSARVNIGITGYSRRDLQPFQRAISNWNQQLFSYYNKTYSALVTPVQLYISSGGPQTLVVSRAKDNTLGPSDNGNPGDYARAVTGNRKNDASGRLFSATTQIIRGMTYHTTLQNTFAHELGHTFGLNDCNKCGPVTVMDTSETSPSTDWQNFTEGLGGPVNADLQVIDAHLPDYHQCIAEDAPPPAVPQCTNGTSVGFIDTGGGNSSYTCGGSPCTGCDSACNNFASAPCPDSGSGSGGGGSTCSQWCGSVCLDWATCSCPGESPTCEENSGGYFPNCNNSCSPIVLDAFGEGFHFTNIDNGVKFRVNAGGPLLHMSWPDPNWRNGWLALDRNGNGTIDDFTELFGNITPQPPSGEANGYVALSVFDDPMNGGNGNGALDPGDSVYDHLRLWIDANHNGISEPGELYSLRDVGIFRIDLKYRLSKYTDGNGNTFRYKSRVWDNAGRERDICYDVFVSVEAQIRSGR